MELFSKEYVKIKDANELISKDNLTDSDKELSLQTSTKVFFSHNLKPSKESSYCVSKLIPVFIQIIFYAI